MEKFGLDEHEVFALLDELYAKDTQYKQVLSSMCTHPHSIAVKTHQRFISANLGDPGLFAGTAEIEQKVVRLIGKLLHGEAASGYLTTGGTEGNIQAVRAARNNRNVKKPNIVVSESAHFSFDKISDLLQIEVRKASVDDVLRVDVESVESLIDKNTIALIGIAGTTEFGQIDPIKELSGLAEEHGLFLHVDAAFGGFVIPFLDKHYDFDFSLSGVTSMVCDPHKMGFSTIPTGGLLFRENDSIERLKTETPYLTSRTQHSLVGTRSGASAAAAYAVMTHLGTAGYKKIVDYCMNLASHLVTRVREIGIEPVIEPVTNVVVLNLPEVNYVREKLYQKGWVTSITRKPVGMRLIMMPHLTETMLDEFISDLETMITSTDIKKH
ncbi:MAG: L-aspartate/L-glutamate decarboxylase [Candidatus Argoarchaeum ethanivorans]|uniref:Probable L-tyrosine/L-aspartate decarboxylase n=1 Tax=Candidatus Argoarchaeum ethanivorans TaxID=2608793 RepID=A0A811T6P7_9EURY|nr:MAG: L-aspartate/L-glutamate decarboxylase [Candidatus Argoarchaeum ethanivorans]